MSETELRYASGNVMNSWVVSDTVPDHRGQTRTKAMEFFAPPPPEIGELRSAESNWKHGKFTWPLPIRLLFALAAAGVTMVVFLLYANDNAVGIAPMGLIIGGIIAVIVAGNVLFWTRFTQRCTYVGKDGIARFVITGRPDANPKQEILLFADMAELHTRQVRHFYNGVYTGTTYNYTWSDHEGERALVLKGRYRAKKGPVKAGDPFLFAVAGEVAWSVHYLERAQHHLTTEGSIPFRVDSKRWIRVGPGFMEFHFGDEPVQVRREEIASVTLGGGKFAFKHKDARWFSREGKFKFNYGDMANARVFLMALDKLMGYRWN